MKRGVGFVVVMFLFFVVVFSFRGSSSFGVSPSSYTVDFEPFLEREFQFNFKLGDNSEQEFEIYVEGDLAEYVALKTDRLRGSGSVDLILALPQKIDIPGKHAIYIGARPAAAESAGTVGITANVRGLIRVWAPYPGRYADVDLSIGDANAGGLVSYRLKIYSRGEESITTESRIKIYNSNNESIKEFNVGNNEISPADFLEIVSDLDVSDLGAGNYWAEAIVKYTGGEKRAQDYFRLGEENVKIINYTSVVDRKSISLFEIEVESLWNDPIEHLYAEVFAVGMDNSFLTPSIELKPWSRGHLQGYLDTSKIEAENFQLKIVLHYGDKITEESVSVRLKEKEFNYLLWGGIALGILIVAGFIVWVVVKLKKLEKKSGKRK